MPSRVRIGSMENLFPHTKRFLCTHLDPHRDQPVHLIDVLSSLCASSPNMSISGSVTRSNIRFIYTAHRWSLHSSAFPETSLWVKWSRWRVHVRVGIDTFTLQQESSCSWILSRYTVCFWLSNTQINARSTLVRARHWTPHYWAFKSNATPCVWWWQRIS